MSLKDLKDALRKTCRKKRQDLCTSVGKEKLDQQLSDKLLSVLPSHSQKSWGSYKAYKSEADPKAACVKRLNWVYPVVNGELLTFYKAIEGEGAKGQEVWIENQFGILEPTILGNKEVSLTDIDGIFIPGLAFDRKGYRLGSGLGFYDKTLIDFIGLKIGVCYSSQLVDEDLPRESHDVPVDIIVTEKEVLSLKERFEL